MTMSRYHEKRLKRLLDRVEDLAADIHDFGHILRSEVGESIYADVLIKAERENHMAARAIIPLRRTIERVAYLLELEK